MPAPAAVQRAASLGLKLAAALAFLPPLLTRIALGNAFFQTGRGKLVNFENFVSFFTDLGIPFPELNAHFIARLEYYGGVLLVLGLFTRLVAAGLASTMVVALLTAERQQFLQSWLPSTELGPLDIPPFVYLVFLTWLIFYGPGLISFDKLVSKWLGVGEGAGEGAASK